MSHLSIVLLSVVMGVAIHFLQKFTDPYSFYALVMSNSTLFILSIYYLITSKMDFVQMYPVEEWHSNGVSATDDPDYNIPVSYYPNSFEGVHSVWKCKSVWARVKFLFSGKVSFVTDTKTHPPVIVGLGEYLKKAED